MCSFWWIFFLSFFFVVENFIYAILFSDKQETGVIDFNELKEMLLGFGEKIDDEDIGLFEKAVGVKEGKVIIEGKHDKII